MCVEKIAGQHVEPIDYNNVPGCTYCFRSRLVGYTEEQAKEKGYEIVLVNFLYGIWRTGRRTYGWFCELFLMPNTANGWVVMMIGYYGYDCRSRRWAKARNHRS